MIFVLLVSCVWLVVGFIEAFNHHPAGGLIGFATASILGVLGSRSA